MFHFRSATSLLVARLSSRSSVSFQRSRKFLNNKLVSQANMATTAAVDTDWIRVTPSNNQVPPFAAYTKPIQKSEQDDREYRIIRLENGLHATLIHDAEADKAAASLDVAVGHLHDPDDMPGLAHFCEHLLFMGTEQFPRENEYSEFLAKNNGGSNAYTSTTNTNYYFNVGTPALRQALARFAAFFHCPLFAPSCTSRELNAVDSEHKKNHQADMWRIFQLNKHLSKPGHVWRKFGSGNRDSLSKAGKDLKAKGKLTNGVTENGRASLAPSPVPSRISSPAPSVASSNGDNEADGGAVGRETRRRLVEWWKKEYCASRMRLCIIGRESLDELSELASTLFSPIANRDRDPLPMFKDHPFGPEERGTLVSVQTIMDFHAVEISFPLEYQAPNWRYKPANLLSHFIGHEGPGSLYSYLKDKGWVTTLSSGPQNLARGFAMFKVTIFLTEEGFKHHRTVSLAAFKYLSLLRSSEIEAWHQRESSILSRTRFRFAEKRKPDDYAVWIAEQMAWPVPKDHILLAPQVTWEWDEGSDGPQKLQEMLRGFTAENGRAVLMAKASLFEKIAPGEQWEHEPWYGTPYRVERLDEAFLKEAAGPNTIPDLFLPGPNEFIPTNLEVDKREVQETAKRPHLIRETPLSSLWHKKDDRFWVPKAHVVIDFRSPVADASSMNAALTKIYTDIVTDILTEYSYDADLAGLSYNFVNHSQGLYVAMQGYNDKMSVLVHHVLEKVKNVVVKPERLVVMKELARRSWENFFLGQSYTLSEYYGRYLLTKQQWTQEERLAQLPSITPELVEEHIKALLSDVNVRILVTGNIYKDEAIKIAEMVEKGLGATTVPLTELNDQSLILPPAANYTWIAPIRNKNQANSSLTYYLNYGPTTDQRLRVVSALLTQILTEPAFNVLRTKEQLGYVVSCSQWVLSGSTQKGVRIVVQSEKSPGYLEERTEVFLDGMKAVLEGMNDEELQEQKNGLKRKWLEADKNLAEEMGRFLAHINTGHFDFLRGENDAPLIDEVTKDELVALFSSHVHPSSPTRAKLSVHMVSQKPRAKKVSSAAAQAFEVLAQNAGVPVDEAASWRDALGGEDATADFEKHWFAVFKAHPEVAKDGQAERLALEMRNLLDRYPVAGEDKDSPREGVTYIEDIPAFKSSLTVAPDPGPMVQWNDLPTSKF
ncbi:hypothetical protein HGRIS_012745 [Hohenbuehelia grisea]|uniref:Insulin-degrading enzyme n=1 Tax=Hohenbuehelia grisea TaxID=104357 RepID=A0ABR3ITC0_9AGAR